MSKKTAETVEIDPKTGVPLTAENKAAMDVIRQHQNSTAKPDLSFGLSDAELALRKETARALAAGEDPFGDDEPIALNQREADEMNAAEAAKKAATTTTDPATATVAETKTPEADDKTAKTGETTQTTGETTSTPAETTATTGEVTTATTPTTTTAEPVTATAATPELVAIEARVLAVQDPVYVKVEDPAALLSRREELETKLDGIESRWMKNEITDDQRAAELKTARRELNDTLVAIGRNDSNLAMNEALSTSSTTSVVNGVKDLGKAEKSIDYDTDTKACVQFNSAMKLLVADEDSKGKTFAQLSLSAHRMVLALRGVTPKATTTAATTTTPATTTTAKTREAPVAPPTLRGLPAAATSHTDGTRGDAIGALKGVDYETAFAKLTPAEKRALADVDE